MSTREGLREALEAHLAGLLGLPPEAVYTGEQAQAVQRQGLEVWLEPDGTSHPVPGTRVLRYLLHLRTHGVLQPRLTAGPESRELGRKAELLVDRVDGRRPFAARLPQLVGLGLSGGEFSTRDQTLDLALELEAVLYV